MQVLILQQLQLLAGLAEQVEAGVELEQVGWDRVGQEQVGLEQVGQEQAGQGQVGQGQVGQEQVGQGQVEQVVECLENPYQVVVATKDIVRQAVSAVAATTDSFAGTK